MALSEKLRAELSAIAGAEAVHTDRVSLLTYSREASVERGHPDAVVLPNNAGQVAALASWAAEHKIPIVGWGGGTGQTGGAVAAHGGLVIAFRNMRRVVSLDPDDSQVVVQPGIITAQLDRAAREAGMLYPPDPASDRASSIGGNIAENSGGPRCCKYGVTANYVLGLATVLPGGTPAEWGGPALDVPEVNFLDVLVGSEGTLALITEARLRLVRRPEAFGTLMASFPSPEEAAQAVTAIIRKGLKPAALEMLDRLLCACVLRSGAATLAPGAGALLIAEVEGYPESLPDKVRQMEEAVRAFEPLDVRLATSDAEREAIWYARKSAFAATAWIAPDDVSMDVAVPRSHLPDAFREISSLGEAAGFQVGYVAHAGDGNIHPEIFCDLGQAGTLKRVNALQDKIIAYVTGLGGSFTGEHGVGLEKRRHMPEMYGPDELRAMLDVKAVFDPENELNPGKIFPDAIAPPSIPAVGHHDLGTRLCPASVSELQEIMAELQAQGQPAWVGGSGTKGAPTRKTAGGLARISTARLGDILNTAYDDLYVTIGAGARVADLARQLQAEGFVLPLAAPWPDATVGGTIAAAFNAPWRSLYGAIRETMLCADVVLPDGRKLRLGRPLVKDVAGYSLAKLFVGSFGALGALTAVSLRVYPQPQASHTWRVSCDRLEDALAAGRVLERASELTNALLLDFGRGPGGAAFRVTCTYAGPFEDVAVAEARGRRALAAAKLPPLEPCEKSGMDAWSGALAAGGSETQLLVRAGVAPSALSGLLAAMEAGIPATWVADLAHGLVYFSSTSPGGDEPAWEGAVRATAEKAGGYAFALGSGIWPPRGVRMGPEGRRFFAALKRRWDPAGILNNGVFFGADEEKR